MLDSQCLENLGHLNEGVVGCPQLLGFDHSGSPIVLGPDDVAHSLVIVLNGILICLFHFHHALDTGIVRVLAPHDHCLFEHVVLDQPEEVVHLLVGLLIKVILTSYKSDSLEHLHTKGLSSDCPNNIDCIPLLLNVIQPDQQDVASPINIVVVTHSSLESLERLLEVLVELLLQGILLLNFHLEVLSLLSMLPLLILSLLLQLSSFLLLCLKLIGELLLSYLEGGFSPSPEGGTIRSPLPVEHGLLEEPLLLAVLTHDIVPFVEASGLLLGDHSDDEVAHDPVCLLLHL